MKEIILSGIRPTGKLHIGNYFGALKNFVELQNKYECYFFIADLHSLNEQFDPQIKHRQTVDLAKDFLAAGLDPKKCTIFTQSHMSEHSELAVILSNVIPVSFLFRMTQYKDKSTDRAQENVNAGLLFYPILMAADILMYKPTKIPVGADQTQHVELARDAAKFFNAKFGQTFPEPQPLYTEVPKIMSLLEPDKKMAKSLGDNHCIYLEDEPEIIKKKISKAVTDTGDGKGLGAQNLLGLVKIFSNKKIFERLTADKNAGNLKYSELKEQLAQDIADYFYDFREKKKKITDAQAAKVLTLGSKRAKKVAAKTMEEVRQKIGIG
ncbi:MAG: tryptophan--tRNA ligase [Candidatus Buchananbacteria bacterium]|nr:tryptophan--tRNA ligase [Candidatus Buchananbacteria bacterium]